MSCCGETSDGDSIMRSSALFVLGNAMTSRIDSFFVMSAINLSKPNAMPPWGGAPYLNALIRKPNFSSASFSGMFNAWNIFFWRSDLCILIEPPAISTPLRTRS